MEAASAAEIPIWVTSYLSALARREPGSFVSQGVLCTFLASLVLASLALAQLTLPNPKP
ncbi:hypothetical protein BDV93DRAFT_566782 [Ceratobasidium sp. AG-I]|nr:hypothetical protein BDV93DRAFT_566782 [Ceratobasidium sp. AG-I]